jgi:hypothetical protein
METRTVRLHASGVGRGAGSSRRTQHAGAGPSSTYLDLRRSGRKSVVAAGGGEGRLIDDLGAAVGRGCLRIVSASGSAFCSRRFCAATTSVTRDKTGS